MARPRDKASQWYSTPRDKRKARPVCLSLDDATRERLDRLARHWRISRSQLVAAAIAHAERALFAQSPELVEAALYAAGEPIE